MKTSLLLGSALGILLLAGTASAATVDYKATLNQAQETPTPTGTGSGSATLSFDTGTKKLTGTITYSGLTGEVNSAHVHEGVCGAPGPVGQPIDAPYASPLAVDVTLTDTQATELAANGLYLNLHTVANAGGEVRGQILAASDTTTKCPAAAGPDAGADAGGTTSGGTSGTTGTSSGATGTSSGDTGTSGTSGTSGTPASTTSDSGCSTTGSNPGSSLALALGVGIAVAAVARGRKKKR